MSTTIVQFRLDEEEIAQLQKRGLEPNQVGRECLRRYLRSLRAAEAMDWIERHPVKKPFDAVKAIREARADLEGRA